MLENEAWKLGGPQRVQLRARSQQRAGTEGTSGPSILIDVRLGPGDRRVAFLRNHHLNRRKMRHYFLKNDAWKVDGGKHINRRPKRSSGPEGEGPVGPVYY